MRIFYSFIIRRTALFVNPAARFSIPPLRKENFRYPPEGATGGASSLCEARFHRSFRLLRAVKIRPTRVEAFLKKKSGETKMVKPLFVIYCFV